MEFLKYTDEIDKSLGVAGMSVALYACDNEYVIARVSIEDGENTFEFTPEAFLVSNPRFSAKITWAQMNREFQVFRAIFLGNALCRCILAGRPLGRDAYDALHDLIMVQGREQCLLDEDEIEDFISQDLRYYQRLFGHPTVAECARSLAAALRAQRRMTSGDILEHLSRLSF